MWTSCCTKLKPLTVLLREGGRKKGLKKEKEKEEEEQLPVMMSATTLLWCSMRNKWADSAKRGHMKRPRSESFPVIHCLYWHRAAQSGPLQTDSPDERDSFLFQGGPPIFILNWVFFVFIKALKYAVHVQTIWVRMGNIQTSKYLTASWKAVSLPTVGGAVHINSEPTM